MGKKLYKVEEGKMISGVCLGMSEILNFDVSIIRLIFTLLTLFSFGTIGVIVYMSFALILPYKSELNENKKDEVDLNKK